MSEQSRLRYASGPVSHVRGVKIRSEHKQGNQSGKLSAASVTSAAFPPEPLQRKGNL
ncbi:Carboxy-terminal-processing protease [Clarias magur]|uniref:Carboxy-terminal-processing protease n=1 Tax=Clarias magur TaxID=1594786 RepID=A0A8J4TWF7_CLAMG|nr:Carboxy-terminal-processing protease [Clarias magur]